MSHLRHELPTAGAAPVRLVAVDRAALQNAINRCATVVVETILGLRPRSIEAISADWPGREDVTEWFGATCQSGIVLAPHVLLYGPSGSGKTQLLTQALQTFCTSCSWVLLDCSGMPGPQQLFEELLADAASALLACCTRLVALVGSVLAAEGIISERMAAAPLARSSRMLHSLVRALTEANLAPGWVGSRAVEFRELDVLSTILQWLPRHQHAGALQECLSAASSNARLSDPTRIELLALSRLLTKRDTAPRCKTLGEFTAQLRQLCSLTVADAANVAVVALLGVLEVPDAPGAETGGSRASAHSMLAAPPVAATSLHWSSAWPPALTSAHLSLRIGLDAAEHLLYLDGPVFTQLMQIQELTGRNISVFATTTAGPACVAATTCLPLQPIQMHFPPPAPADVVRLLQRDPIPAGGVANQALYNRFVELAERAFGQTVGYNVRELRRAVCALYPAFSLPVAQEGVPAAATRQLFERVRPHFERMRGSLLQPGGAPELRPLPSATAYDTDLPVDPLTGRYEVPYDDCELQLSTMCSLGLIDRASAVTELVAPRFSCRLPLEAAIRLADGVGLKLANFIHDPTV